MDVIMQMISTVGFPIAMCLLLFWYINNTMKQVTVAIQALKTTVDNNTAVVEKLNNRLDKLEEDIHD